MKTTILLTLFMIIFSTSAAADTVNSEVKVTYAELNLQNEAGVRVLYKRLIRASKAVCGENENATLLPPSSVVRDHRSCVKESLSNAVSQIDNPRLTAIHISS